MSGTPSKKLHEDVGGHPSTLKYPHETKQSHEDSASYPSAGSKLTSSVMSEYHASYDMGHDARAPKIPRTESRDADRSPILPMSRISSSSHVSRSDHPVALENKFEKRESKDSSRDTKNDNRGLRTESREVYQTAKVDKDVRSESRGDDNKEIKYDREIYPDYKSEMKTDKEAYNTGNNQLSWKESKEHFRGKRYSDTPGGNVDTWHASRAGVHGPAEVGKEGSTTEERDHTEAHEAVGENKVDLKADDKFKDKDRKRKEGKHRESGERDKERSDPRGNLQLGNSSNEGKESVRDEKEAEKCDKERKDLPKDKDKLKEREKDHTKRDTWNGADREIPQKEMSDVSGRVMDLDIPAGEHKKQKDHHGWKQTESWKNLDKEAKGGKKERDVDMEGDQAEKRSRCYDKESDDGCVDAEGGNERERDAFSYGVQQRKRMLRPRGSPMANRDPRSKSRVQENEGYFILIFTRL